MERDVLQRLLDQAFLYDDPGAYQAGVHAAWSVLARDDIARPSQDQSLREASSAASAVS